MCDHMIACSAFCKLFSIHLLHGVVLMSGKRLFLLIIFLGAAFFSGATFACDYSDGRWTNCPENPDLGGLDEFEQYVMNFQYPMYFSTGYYPSVVPSCSSSRQQKDAYAAWISQSGMVPTGAHLNYKMLRIQYSDRTWDHYEFVTNAQGLPDGTGQLLHMPGGQNWLLGWQVADGGACLSD